MKKLLLLGSFVALVVGGWGAPAQRLFLVTHPKGWKSVEALEDGKPPAFPTIKYVPADGRNAEVLISLIGKSPRIADMDALRAIHDLGCQRAFKVQMGKYETRTVKLPHGEGYYSIFEDPNLVGKPPVREDYKFTTSVDILFDTGEIAHATLFADERTGPTASEEMAILQSCDIHPAVIAAGDADSENAGIYHVVGGSGLDALLGIPKDGLEEAPLSNPNGGENYFSFIKDGVMDISGWIEPAEKYPGFRKMWAADKGKMELGMGAKIQNETFMTIDGWEVVFYTLKMGKVEQPNLRASRIAGNTWLDVHLSTMNKTRSTGAMKELLQSFTVQLPPGSAQTGVATPPVSTNHPKF